MSMTDGERQVAPTLAGIRPDHKARYTWAADHIKSGLVVDAGCGVGYGASILADAGLTVRAYDNDPEAIEFAKKHYNSTPNITYSVGSIYDVQFPKNADAVVAFEILEHVAKPEKALRRWREMAPKLLLSVPNENNLKYGGAVRHHFRHYKPEEIEQLLLLNGWRVKERYGQKDAVSEVEPDVDGRTIVLVAEREDAPIPIEELAPDTHDAVLESLKLPGRELPKSVAIVAMGGSCAYYYHDTCRAGGYERIADEVWTMNMMAGVMKAHRVFHMDDFSVQESRATLCEEQGNDARGAGLSGMLDTLRASDVPVYTSKPYEDYPQSVEYPLEWVLNKLGTHYMNSTVAYAVCLALAMGVEHLMLYGCDFSYPQGDRHKGEKGRACLEFWLGYAARGGLKLTLPPYTTLLDTDVPRREEFYGYDTEWITLEQKEGGGFHVGRVDRSPEDIPTAQEIERRYSHDSRIDTTKPRS